MTPSAITDYVGFREGVFCVVFLVTVLYIKHLHRYNGYWKKQNVVHEELQLFWHPISRLLEKPIHEIDMDRQKKYGKIFGAFEGPKPTLIVSDPNLVKLVLVKSFQSLPDRRHMKFNDPMLDNMMSMVTVDRWRKIRPAASPAFATGRLRKNHHDFLQLMVDAQGGGLWGSSEVSQDAEDKLYNLGTERAVEQTADLKALNEDEAMAQCVTFFIAGQDTTSSVIAHTAYLLALHPEVQQRLKGEVDDCFKRCGGEPSFDDISKLKYLNCVISECLRLYPPAVRIERTACEDVTLGDSGFELPKECIVAIPIFAMHHDPEYFPDPEKFDPERVQCTSLQTFPVQSSRPDRTAPAQFDLFLPLL